MPLFQTSQLNGLTPLLDNKQLGEPSVVEGKNFLVKADGPVSAFGKDLVIHEGHLAVAEYIQSIVVNEETEAFIFTAGAILIFNETADNFFPVFTFIEPGTKWPWSHATVGGVQYFARRDVGLIQFTEATQTWVVLSGGAVPTDIYAVAQSAGRLIVLALGIVAWTAIDDGTDFVTSELTGAGFQALAIINNGSPFTVLEYVGGFIVYTSQGLLRGEAVNSLIPFRFKVLSKKHQPITPWAISTVQEFQHIFLTREGLFETQGDLPVQWQPLFSEYLHDKVLPNFDLKNIATLKLFHAQDKSWTVFSISEDQTEGIYSKAFVLYNPTEKWGSYNQTHTGFIDVRRTTGADINFSLGVVENNGEVFKFIDSVDDHLFPDEEADIHIYDYHANVEYPVRVEAGVNKMPSVFRLVTQDESIFARSGIYDLRFVIQNNVDEDQTAADVSPSLPGPPAEMKTAVKFSSGIVYTGVAFATKQLRSLNAEILIGPFRAGEQETTDELSNILNLSIGMLDQGIADEFIDWLLDFTTEVFEDWLDAGSPDEFEDWGIGATSGTLYDELVRGTIDGNSAWEVDGIVMEENPTLIAQNGRQRHLSCDVTGLYNFVKITADQQGQSFALRTLDLNIQPAGVLY